MHKTLLLTDIINSTKLTETLGDEAMAKIWIEHDHLARELLTNYNGQEADRTDGFLMLFDSVNEASIYAIDLHNAFKELSKKWEVDFQARIGIHTGDIILIETTEEHRAAGVKHIEVEGIAKPMAARVMSVASGGQTLLSKDAMEAFSTNENDSFKIVSHGHWHLKGVEQPIELFEIGTDDSHFHPPIDTEKVSRMVLDGEIWVPVKTVPNNLPKEADSFVGRKEELRDLAELIAEEHTQLVTILGPGGTGKTRLSKRYGKMWMADYPGGVWFCDLAEAKSLEGIAVAIATTFDTPLAAGDPIQQLSLIIEAKEDCLVILDNFEQITEFAEACLREWMVKAPKSQFIVTSRNSLNLPGEKSFDLTPLPIETDGVSLFISRAKDRNRKFELDDNNREDIKDIVAQLDGMPLAIELAAARVAILKPKQIRERLKDRFKLLSGNKGDSDRQKTLEAAIDWSWDLLEEWEKSALAQCSVFEGGFTLEAAEGIIDLSEFDDAPYTMDVIQALVDKSLLRSELQRYDIDEPWYGMYVSINHYCRKKLSTENQFQNSGSEFADQCRFKHAEFYAQYGTDDGIRSIWTSTDGSELSLLFAELDNLVKAHKFCVAQNQSSLATKLVRCIWQVVRASGPPSAIVPIAEESLGITGISEKEKLEVCKVLTFHAAYAFNSDLLEKYFAIGMEIAKQNNDEESEGELFRQRCRYLSNVNGHAQIREVLPRMLEITEKYPNWEGGVEVYQLAGETELAIYENEMKHDAISNYFKMAIDRAERLEYFEWKGGVLNSYGNYYKDHGQFDKAIECYAEAIEMMKTIKNKLWEAVTVGNIAHSYFQIGEFRKSDELFLKARTSLRELGSQTFYGANSIFYSYLMFEEERFEEAERMLQESLSLFEEKQDRVFQSYILATFCFGRINQGKLEEARSYINEALKVSEGITLPNLTYYAGFTLAYLDGMEGKYQEATKEFERLDKELENTQYKTERANLLLFWSKAAHHNKEAETAKAKLEQAYHVAESIGMAERSEMQRGIDQFREEIA